MVRFIGIMALATTLFSEVRISGVQETDLNLKAENSPYIITGDILIKSRTLWTVNPGVVIKISPTSDFFLDTVRKKPVPLSNNYKLITIYVEGAFQCVGSPDKRIVIEPLEKTAPGKVVWRGIVFSDANDEYTRLFYTDIRGAVTGVSVFNCSPVIRNCLIERNQTGLLFGRWSKSRVFNNNVMNNYSTGILNKRSIPYLFSNIIGWNLVGVWSDRVSRIRMEYNDFWENADGDFLDCPPQYGILSEVNHRGDSCDAGNNLFVDPLFFGSKGHEDSLEHDIRVATDTAKADVENKKLSRFIVETLPPEVKKAKALNVPHKPFQLSEYSRLINAGNPDSDYQDADGTRNDIGMYGGSEFKFE